MVIVAKAIIINFSYIVSTYFLDRRIVCGRIRIQCALWNNDRSVSRYGRKEKSCTTFLRTLFVLLLD